MKGFPRAPPIHTIVTYYFTLLVVSVENILEMINERNILRISSRVEIDSLTDKISH